ncbi:hypothetical protein D3C80_1797150 [compost metagenome]
MGCLKMLLRMQFDPVQVVVTQGQAAQRAVDGFGQLPQALLIEVRLQRAPFGIDAGTALGVMQNTAVVAANGQYHHLQVAAF